MAGAGQALANVNFWRYSSAVFVVGQRVMWQAFHWLYHHHNRHQPGLYVGECLRDTPKGMKNIGAKERAILDAQEDPANMDIPLLYQLLQHTCGLTSETKEFAWNKPQSEAQRQGLEHRLYQTKNVRNALCHNPPAFMHMTDAELDTHLRQLRELLCSIVRAAGWHSARPMDEVEEVVARVTERLTFIQTSNPSSAILPQEFALLARGELAQQWQHCPTGRRQLSAPLLRWTAEAQEVPLSELLQGPEKEQPPQVLIVLGEPGIGKSSLCWQLMEAWLQGDVGAPEVAALEVVVPVECREVFTRDLTRLLMERLLPQTCRRCRPEEVLGLLGALRVLWLVDGFEEAMAEARSVVTRLAEQCGTGHVVLLTGQPDYLGDMRTTLSGLNIQVCHVTHCGLTEHGFSSLLASLLQEPGGEGGGEAVWEERRSSFTQEVAALSPGLLQELHNPLKLMLALQLWQEGRLKEAAGAPLTRLYAAIQDSLVAKLTAKLWAKGSMAEAEVKDRVRRWVSALCAEALTMWARGCFVNLDEKAEQHLRDRAVELLLPYTDCFSTFLACQAGVGPCHSFLHHTQQIVMAAQYVHTLLLQHHTAEEVQCMLLPGQPSNTTMDSFLGVLIHAATSLAAEESLDEERARVLARLLEQCSLCQWLEVVRLTKCCLSLAREAHSRLPGEWHVIDSTVGAAATLVRIGAPHSIIIDLCEDPRDNPDLLLLLQDLGKTYIEVTLCTHHNMRPEVPRYSTDALLLPLCNPASSCRLVEFWGALTGEGCRILHHHRHSLHTLTVAVLDSTALDQVILLSHQSDSLQILGIHLFCVSDATPKMPVSERVQVQLSLMKVEDGAAERAVTLIRGIGHSFSKITLQWVTPATVCSMIRAFKKHKVRALSLGKWVGVSIPNLVSDLMHVHFVSLPPPPDIALRTLYKMWSNPRIKFKLEVTQTSSSPITTHIAAADDHSSSHHT